jgi:hypothetical protein
MGERDLILFKSSNLIILKIILFKLLFLKRPRFFPFFFFLFFLGLVLLFLFSTDYPVLEERYSAAK